MSLPSRIAIGNLERVWVAKTTAEAGDLLANAMKIRALADQRGETYEKDGLRLVDTVLVCPKIDQYLGEPKDGTYAAKSKSYFGRRFVIEKIEPVPYRADPGAIKSYNYTLKPDFSGMGWRRRCVEAVKEFFTHSWKKEALQLNMALDRGLREAMATVPQPKPQVELADLS